MLVLLAGAASPAAAQSGDGATAAAVLSLPAGSRAAAMGGAYTASHDVDVLFYNPAGAARLAGAVSIAYESRVSDVGYATIAATVGVGPASVGISIGHLDFGSIQEVVPDPDFNGQRGRPTGETVDGGEGVARVLAALPLGRASIGAAVGVLYTTLAETGRTATFFDGGLQYRLRRNLSLGVAVRNLGPDVTGARMSAAPMPGELRIGLGHTGMSGLLPAGVTARFQGDVVADFETGRWGAAAGTEVDVAVARAFTAAVRAGYDGTNGPAGLGRLHLGAGLSRDGLGIDYALQHMGALGTVHRFGLRWSRDTPWVH